MFAAVVSLFARTKRIIVVAYAAPTAIARGPGIRRAAGTIARTASAAIPDRKLATCHPVRAQALIAAPPVEKSAAAARISRRERAGARWSGGAVIGRALS